MDAPFLFERNDIPKFSQKGALFWSRFLSWTFAVNYPLCVCVWYATRPFGVFTESVLLRSIFPDFLTFFWLVKRKTETVNYKANKKMKMIFFILFGNNGKFYRKVQKLYELFYKLRNYKLQLEWEYYILLTYREAPWLDVF